jgi:hypothetical protein
MRPCCLISSLSVARVLFAIDAVTGTFFAFNMVQQLHVRVRVAAGFYQLLVQYGQGIAYLYRVKVRQASTWYKMMYLPSPSPCSYATWLQGVLHPARPSLPGWQGGPDWLALLAGCLVLFLLACSKGGHGVLVVELALWVHCRLALLPIMLIQLSSRFWARFWGRARVGGGDEDGNWYAAEKVCSAA